MRERSQKPNGDVHERQAEGVANRVMQMAGSRLTRTPRLAPAAAVSSGQPLDESTRRFMEPRFRHDFSDAPGRRRVEWPC